LSEKAVAEVATTRDQVNAQREAALRKQRERSASFQPPFVASPQP